MLWACSEAPGAHPGLADINGNLSMDFNRLGIRPLVCNLGHRWFLLTRDGRSGYKTSLQWLWLSKHHSCPDERSVWPEWHHSDTSTLMAPASLWSLWFSFSTLSMKNATCHCWALGVQPFLLHSPSSLRVCFSTWCWLNCKIYNQENLKDPFSILDPICSSGHPAESPACDWAALYWCEEVQPKKFLLPVILQCQLHALLRLFPSSSRVFPPPLPGIFVQVIWG